MSDTLHDSDILTAFQRHDRVAEEALFHRFFRPLCAYAERITGHQPAAEDIVVDAFRKCMDRRTEFKSLDNCKAFLFRVVRNGSLNYSKAERNHRRAHETIGFLQRADVEEEGTEDLERLRAELLQEIYTEIETL